MARKFKTMDGNNAAAHVSYAFTDVAAIYPITPSSVMAEETDKWAATGQENLFGRPVKVAEMQSEVGARWRWCTAPWRLSALTTTYTASQGLLLMIPNMYKIAGELLPNVIHVSARALASHALSIFGDHSDVYACRQTGYAMLCSSSVQEVMDLGAVAHLSTIKGRVPFLHFFDGFRTSHEIQKIQVWDYEDLKEMLDWDAVDRFRRHALNPEHPVQRGTAQNPDIFFQAREACNTYYEAIPDVVDSYMKMVNKKIGTNYKLFNYYGPRDAKRVIICMGSACETIEETVDHLNAAERQGGPHQGPPVSSLLRQASDRGDPGQRGSHLRPRPHQGAGLHRRAAVPGRVRRPEGLQVRECAGVHRPVRPGLQGHHPGPNRRGISQYGSRPSEEALHHRHQRRRDQAVPEGQGKPGHHAPRHPLLQILGPGLRRHRGRQQKLHQDHRRPHRYVRTGLFLLRLQKSGGVTISHLRFGKKPIKSTYFVSKADFVACHNPSYVDKYDMVSDVKPGGTFLLNCAWDVEELDKRLPAAMKRTIAKNDIKFYTIDATHIAIELGLGNRTNTILQAAFFKLARVIPTEDAVRFMKEAATKSYSKKGDAIVKMNHDAIERGVKEVKKIRVPKEWAKAKEESVEAKVEGGREEIREYIDNVLSPHQRAGRRQAAGFHLRQGRRRHRAAGFFRL